MECSKCKGDFHAHLIGCEATFCVDCFASENFYIGQKRVCQNCSITHSRLYGELRKQKADDAFKRKDWKSAMALYQGLEDAYKDAVVHCRLALMYERGLGGIKDTEKAKQLFSTAIPLLLSDPQNFLFSYYLGVVFDNGYGVALDKSLAFSYYKYAADNGDSNAQYNIGLMYQYGRDGVNQDHTMAFKYFKLSANRENSNAQFKLGYLYHNGLGVEQDNVKAFQYYDLAANQDDREAYCNLGYMYQYGHGIDQNYAKAFECYNRAVEMKCVSAYSQLGYLYENGFGVPVDYQEAYKYYKMASDLGIKSGHAYLGHLYEAALGLEQNLELAIYYYNLAAAQNDDYSIERLKELNKGKSEEAIHVSKLIIMNTPPSDISPTLSPRNNHKNETNNNLLNSPRDKREFRERHSPLNSPRDRGNEERGGLFIGSRASILVEPSNALPCPMCSCMIDVQAFQEHMSECLSQNETEIYGIK